MSKFWCLIGGWAAAFVVGCGPTKPTEPKEFTDPTRGIQFTYPGDWVVEDLGPASVLLLTSPVEEARWQTNVFLEVRRELDTPVEERLAELVQGLQESKNGFVLQSSTTLANHPSGLAGGELIYEHSLDGVLLTDREMVLWMGNNFLLFVTGSAVTDLWGKYESELNTVFDSVRPTS